MTAVVGEKAPDFVLMSTNGEQVSLASMKGKTLCCIFIRKI